MTGILHNWLQRLWDPIPKDQRALLDDYRITFSSPSGGRVLQHLVDTVYASVYEGNDPVALAVHNGRRSVIQEILTNVHASMYPGAYEPKEGQDGILGGATARIDRRGT